MTDEWEHRLRAADPAGPSTPIDPARSERARSLVEDIMDTPVIDTPAAVTRRPGRLAALAAAAAVVVAAGIGVATLGGDDDAAPAGTTLALALPGNDGGTSIGSCVMFDPQFLADMDLAFDGVATAVDGPTATFEVTEWFKGGDADLVTVTNDAGPGSEALIDGFAIETGERYLIAATAGTVNLCGFSGPWSSELDAGYRQAFGS